MQADLSKFKASLVCRVSSKTSRATQRNHVLRNNKTKSQILFRAWRRDYFLTNEIEMCRALKFIRSSACTPAAMLNGCVNKGISDQQMNSGLSDLSTEQKSQLQEKSRCLAITLS